MLRHQTIEKLRDERSIFKLLKLMATSKTCQYSISLSNSEINSLRSEITVFYKKWLSHGYVGTLTSHSKFSFVYAEKLANIARKKLLTYVHSCQDYAAQNGIQQTYGYGFTVNPKNLKYDQTNILNQKIVGMLRKNKKTMLIQKEIENTYYHCGNNIHFQYFVLSAKPLPRRKIERSASRIGKQITGTVTRSKMLEFDDISKAVSYATKQYGLPLPLKHRKHDPLDQFQHFMRLPMNKKMKLLAEDINAGKGIEKHRMYVNSRNQIAHQWWSCLNKSELMPAGQTKDDHSSRENQSLTLFGISCRKLYKNAHKRSSEHHKSTSEALSQWCFDNIYELAKRSKELAEHREQTSLF